MTEEIAKLKEELRLEKKKNEDMVCGASKVQKLLVQLGNLMLEQTEERKKDAVKAVCLEMDLMIAKKEIEKLKACLNQINYLTNTC
jgi:hypothetical protein